MDFNVSIDEHGNVTDDARIRAALPTVKYLLEKHAIVILMSHFGRPDGKPVQKYRMEKVAESLGRLLGKKVKKASDCIGKEVTDTVSHMKGGEIVLLENLRFHAEEEKNDATFAKQLAALGDVYINDAFGASHRAHASVAAITQFLPSYAGLLLEKEVNTLTKALENPKKPLIAIIGGAKVSDKLALIKNLSKKSSAILLGGAMVFTIYRAMGLETGKSKVEEDKVAMAKELLGCNLTLPVDFVAAGTFSNDAPTSIVRFNGMPKELMCLDIGPETVKRFVKEVARAKTVIWNGPMGVFEFETFEQGTRAIAEAVAKSGAETIVGGGDTIAALKKFGMLEQFSFVSTGGGAMLELLEGKKLPAVAALEEAAARMKQ